MTAHPWRPCQARHLQASSLPCLDSHPWATLKVRSFEGLSLYGPCLDSAYKLSSLCLNNFPVRLCGLTDIPLSSFQAPPMVRLSRPMACPVASQVTPTRRHPRPTAPLSPTACPLSSSHRHMVCPLSSSHRPMVCPSSSRRPMACPPSSSHSSRPTRPTATSQPLTVSPATHPTLFHMSCRTTHSMYLT